MPTPTDYKIDNPAMFDQTSPAAFQRYMFDLVERMKSLGLGRDIDLPQLIVVGDQSSGKSSVLSSIARLKFPTKDTLCTMFATELSMRQTAQDQPNSFSIRIMPSEKRNKSDKLRLQNWTPTTEDLHQFPEIVSQAGNAMYKDTGVARFTEDVSRVELSGSALQNLDLVDLPGLFHSAGPEQTLSDVEKVKQLVLKYMARKRTVVLAVISGKDDLASQVVTNLVGQCQATDRTLAVITKPDTLDEEPNKQKAFLQAMQNNLPALSFAHGWHVLRNKKYSEQNFSWDQRDNVEAGFFKTGAWAEISEKQKGIAALVVRLQQVQGDRITESAEAMAQELVKAVRRDEEQLAILQPKTPKIDVASIGNQFRELISKAVNGPYTHRFFKMSADHKLKPRIDKVLDSFDEQMKSRGRKWKILKDVETALAVTGLQQPENIKRAEFIEKISDRLAAAGAMPGQFVQEVFDDLFYEQAQAWPAIVNQMVEDVFHSVSECARAILIFVCPDVTVSDKVFGAVVKEQFDALRSDFETYVNHKIQDLLSRSTITLDPKIKNHVIPSAFKNEWRSVIQARVPELIQKILEMNLQTPVRASDASQAKLVEAAVEIMDKNVNIQRFDATVMEASLEHYYETQLKKTIDHFDSDNVRRHLLSKLPSLFPQTLPASFDAQASTLITEDPEFVQKRAVLSEHLDKLRVLHEDMKTVVQQKNRKDIVKRKRNGDAGDESTVDATPDKRAKRGAGSATPGKERRRG